MKGFLTKEIIDGIEKWVKFCCYCLAAIWFINILPYLPDEIAEPIINKLLGFLK